MSNAVLGKWLKKDVKQRKVEHFKRIGIDIEFEALTWKDQKSLVKEHTVKMKGGKEIFEKDNYNSSLIAKSIVAADGEPLDLTNADTLKEIGVTNIDDAISVLFTMGEVNRIVEIIEELSGSEDEKEVEELKN